MKPAPEETYERARRLANFWMWTIRLQCRRIQSGESEDKEFLFRKWADFDFLIVALSRLRRTAVLATSAHTIEPQIKKAIEEFDLTLPDLKTMRDTAEHIDDYATDSGRKKEISRKMLEGSKLSATKLEWLGVELDTVVAMSASEKLFKAIQENPPIKS